MSTVKETENLKRLNFNKMMDSILDAISNDGQYELFKNSLLCDKDNQYRKQRKAFHVILQAFGICQNYGQSRPEVRIYTGFRPVCRLWK